jgi:hypothetical protein
MQIKNQWNECLSFSGSEDIIIIIISSSSSSSSSSSNSSSSSSSVLCHYHHHRIFVPVCHNFYLSYLTVIILILISYSSFFTA